MATGGKLKRKTPRGNARFEIEDDGKTLSVHVDRQGFRRLLETLERLAETGEVQTFEKSGRGHTRSVRGTGEQGHDLQKLMFRIDDN